MATQAQQPSKRPGKKTLAATLGAAAAASLVALTASQEGVSLKPYNDRLANNIQTVCFGETNVEMRAYSLPECKSMLGDSLAGYAESVRAITPGFDTLTDGQKVAVVDLAYNIGMPNYKGSTLRKRYIARDFPNACNEFIKWRFVAGKDCAIAANRCGGIVTRRQIEAQACRGN
ncbi:glycoside hydrolase family protein [Caballeronia sp. INML2]|uniref:glycoside hydrolase family protein n=1 Tax=Caballeronia sp. INML2 TaxID=2921748 RepID=UPI002028FE46|nr:glycoside hydrolase family protein [Caballeronia sp. INML2]